MEWHDQSFLYRVWRRRDAQLLRLLTAKNLGMIRDHFEKEEEASKKSGLSVADFVRIMVKLLGGLALNEEELCIQILELFANIDVNADRTLEWEEFLNYIVESGYGGGNISAAVSLGDSGSSSSNGGGGSDADSYFATKYAYRQLSAAGESNNNTSANGSGGGGGGGGDTNAAAVSSSASSIFDVFTHATWHTDPDTETVFLLGYRYRGMIVTALRFGQEMQMPVALPFRRFRHDFAFASHHVLQVAFVPEAGQLVTCSIEHDGGPAHLNFFNFGRGNIIRRVQVDAIATHLLFVPSMQLVYGIANEGGMVYSVDVPTGVKTGSFSQGDILIEAALPVPGNLSGCLFAGTNEGAIGIWDLRAGKPIPGMRVLAHDFGVKNLALSESRGLLVSTGGPHPRRLQGLSPMVYAVLVWDVKDWINQCREGDVYARVTSGAPSTTTMGGPGASTAAGLSSPPPSHGRRGILSSSSSSGQTTSLPGGGMTLAATISASSKAMRPRVLIGHRFPVTAIALQEESGVAPHIVSVDEGGQMRVWDMSSGDCLQCYALFPQPRTAMNNRAAIELGKAGLQGNQQQGDGEDGGDDDDDSTSGRHPGGGGGARVKTLNDSQKASLVNFLSSVTNGVGPLAAATASGLLPPSPPGRRRNSAGGSTGGPAAHGGRRMSYSSASVMLYPDKGEGAAEADVRALVAAGALDEQLGGNNALVEGVLRTGNKYGVGVSRGNNGFFSSAVTSGSSLDGDDNMVADGGDGNGMSRAQITAAQGNNAGTSLSNPPSLLSTALALVGLPGLAPTVSARRMRVMGDLNSPSNQNRSSGLGASYVPTSSQTRQLAHSAASAANTFRKEQQRAAEHALREAGLQVSSIPVSARKALLSPISPSKALGASPPRFGRRRSSVGVLNANGGNVLSSMLDLRLQGRRGSISDLAMMLQQEATSQQAEDSDARRKALSEASGGVAVSKHGGGGSGQHQRDGEEDGRIQRHAPPTPTGVPSFLLLLPKSVGGQEKRSLLVVGGERSGLTAALAQAGGLAARHGMRILTWMQDLPDREPLIASSFISPSLNFMTATASAIVIWDALSGRPLRVYDNRFCEKKEITSAILDGRQRKIIVGDTAGKQWVINLVSGAVMKQLDPRASKPRKAVMAALEQKAKAAAAASMALTTMPARTLGGMLLPTSGGNTSNAENSSGVDSSNNNNYNNNNNTGGNGGMLSVWGTTANSSIAGGTIVNPATSTTNNNNASFGPSSSSMGGSAAEENDPQDGNKNSSTRRGASNNTSTAIVPANTITKKTDSSGRLAPYHAPITQLSFSPRLEVLSVASDGSVWLCEETSSGWGLGSGISTIVRVFSLPLEHYRNPFITPVAPFVEEYDPIICAVHGKNGYGFLSGYAPPHHSHHHHSYPPASSSSSALTLPAIEAAGGSILASPNTKATVNASSTLPSASTAATAEAEEAAAAAAAANAAAASDYTAAAPPLDGTLRVTYVAFSVRLNLLATCSRFLKDVPKTAKEGHEENGGEAGDLPGMNGGAADGNNAESSGTAGRSASGLIDDDSHILLIFDYEKATLLGGCARSATDRKTGTRHTLERYNAAAVLASMQASVIQVPGAPLLGNESSNGPLKLEASSDLLLPAVTTMAFLDPLAALISCHDDGGIRIWSLPPAQNAFSLRIMFYIPANPAIAVYSKSGKKVSQAHAKRQLTIAAKRIATKLGADTTTTTGTSLSLGANDSSSSSATADGNNTRSVSRRRRSSVAGEDPEEIPILMQRRYAVCMTSRPAHLTPAMPLGSLFPKGHAAYMPGEVVTPTAPAPAASLFHEKPRGPEATGHLDPTKLSTGYLKDPKIAHELPASPEGIVFWFGDTDGEVHRFFVPSTALAAAGLSAVPAVGLDDTIVLERRVEDSAPHSSNVAVSLSWSRSQSKAWAAKQIRHSQSAIAYLMHIAAAANAETKATSSEGDAVATPHLPSSPVHPALFAYFAQAGRHPLFPVVGETLPPTTYSSADDSNATFGVSPFTASITHNGTTLSGPPGVIWEGSWRAHSSGDVVSIQAIADSGFYGILSAGQDGLARIWDTCGRLMGSLDPQPRFTAPIPEWELHDALAELLEKTMAKKHVRGGDNDDDDKFSLPSEATTSPDPYSNNNHHQGGGADGKPYHFPTSGDDGSDGRGSETSSSAHEFANAAEALATIPKEYGPGTGSGYSFDRWSMTHVCTDRVYDGRLVYIPSGANLKDVTSSTSAHGSRLLSLPGYVSEQLPPTWRPGTLGTVGKTPPTMFGPRLSLHHPPSDDVVAILQGVVLDAAEVPKARNTNRRRSSVGVNGQLAGPSTHLSLSGALPSGSRGGVSGGAFSTLAASISPPIAATQQVKPSPAGPGAAKGTVVVPPIAIAAVGAGSSANSTGSNTIIIASSPGPKEVGLYFGALAPPQRQVLWHIEWDLVMRRSSQAVVAEQALSLVKLVKLRDVSGWGRRSSLIQSAARRLSEAMISLAASEAVGAGAGDRNHNNMQQGLGDRRGSGASERRVSNTAMEWMNSSISNTAGGSPPSTTSAIGGSMKGSGLATAITQRAVNMARQQMGSSTAEEKLMQSPTSKSVRIAEGSPTVARVGAGASGGLQSPRGAASSSLRSPRNGDVPTISTFAKMRRDDPVTQTLFELRNEAIKEHEAGLDVPMIRTRLSKGQSVEQRMRQEAAKQAIAKRKAERQKAAQAASDGTSSDPKPGVDDSDTEEPSVDALSSLVAALGVSRKSGGAV